jgi:hypothetical protein
MKIYLRTPISYYGGKQQMLRHILPLIPEHNVLCMSSGTCTTFQISTKLSVPLLIHCVSHSTFLNY